MSARESVGTLRGISSWAIEEYEILVPKANIKEIKLYSLKQNYKV